MFLNRFSTLATAGFISLMAIGAHAEEGLDLNTAAKKSNNPVSDAWLLIIQNDLTWLGGDAIDGSEVRERLSFQPVMPVPIFGGD